jgi:hypothetical protein
MQAVPLGKITVSVPGTPVAITACSTQYAAMIEFNADPAMVGATVSVKDVRTGAVIAELLKPANGIADHWQTPHARQGDPLRISDLALDAEVGGDGAFVTAWVN